jgi:hypothetical protein
LCSIFVNSGVAGLRLMGHMHGTEISVACII